MLNPTPSLTDNYLWIPETYDNVVPGLDSLLTYTQSTYATLTALQNSITNINNTINNEIQTLQTETNNVENNPGTGNVSKESHYHTSHTDFMFKRHTTNNGNSRQFVIQNHYFTYQRKANTELAIQASNIRVADLQNQINNLNSGYLSQGGAYKCFLSRIGSRHNYIFLYIIICMCVCIKVASRSVRFGLFFVCCEDARGCELIHSTGGGYLGVIYYMNV